MKVQNVDLLKAAIAYVEKRAKISVKKHLDFGDLHTPLNTYTDEYDKHYGELNADGKEHGRGISIEIDSYIRIGYYEHGELSTGNYIIIHSDGKFKVGEIYNKDGGRRGDRGTRYNRDGTEEQYGY